MGLEARHSTIDSFYSWDKGLNFDPDNDMGYQLTDGSPDIIIGSLPEAIYPFKHYPAKSKSEAFEEALLNGVTGSYTFYLYFLKEQTTSVNPDNGMAQLSAAAETGKEEIFAQAAAAIDWRTRTAEHFVQAIQLALSIGAHSSARQLLSEGYQRFPDHHTLGKMANILLAAKATQVKNHPDPSLRTNRDWLAQHGSEYHGQWIALDNGQLLGRAETLQELKNTVANWREATLVKTTW